MGKRLGDILLERELISQSQLAEVLGAPNPQRAMLGDRLLARGMITPGRLGEALAEQFGVPFRDLDLAGINRQIVRLIPEPFARQNSVVPVGLSGRTLELAMTAPDEIDVISETELITGYHVQPVVSLADEVQKALDHGFDSRLSARQTTVDMKLAELAQLAGSTETEDFDLEEEEDAPVIRLVRAILSGAISADASDVHLEPHAPEMRVRYRVDGELQEVMTIPSHAEEAVIARIKVMADMDTTETRRPQDGHISVVESGAKVNFRVSAVPAIGGEKIVLRLLDEGTKVFALDKMGFSDPDRERIQAMIDKPHGMVIITGPTGSGKSTTMYAMLSRLNEERRNIVSVEDPVEYRINGINQVQSDNDFGMGFANALKYIMGQDPDVIMVGEIRDQETAKIAVQAALTGHLLISTLHTNDAVGAVARLNDLGVDEFKIAGALLGSVAQRLLRKICPRCKELDQPRTTLLEALSAGRSIPAGARFFRGRGCKECLGTGFSGRTPIFEIMTVTPELGRAIEARLPTGKLREVARAEGMSDLRQAAFDLALRGNTTVEEAYFKTSS